MSKAITSCKKALAYLLTAAMVLGMAVTSPITAETVKAAISASSVTAVAVDHTGETPAVSNADVSGYTSFSGAAVDTADENAVVLTLTGLKDKTWHKVSSIEVTYRPDGSTIDETATFSGSDITLGTNASSETTATVKLLGTLLDGATYSAKVYIDNIAVSGSVIPGTAATGEKIEGFSVGSDGKVSMYVAIPKKASGNRDAKVTANVALAAAPTQVSDGSSPYDGCWEYKTNDAVTGDVAFSVEFMNKSYDLTIEANTNSGYVITLNSGYSGEEGNYKIERGTNITFTVSKNTDPAPNEAIEAVKVYRLDDEGNKDDDAFVSGDAVGVYTIKGEDITSNIKVELTVGESETATITANVKGNYKPYKVRTVSGKDSYEEITSDGILFHTADDADKSIVLKDSEGNIIKDKNLVSVYEKYDGGTEEKLEPNESTGIITLKGALADTKVDILTIDSRTVKVSNAAETEEAQYADLKVGETIVTSENVEAVRGNEFKFTIVPKESAGKSIDTVSIVVKNDTTLAKVTGLASSSGTASASDKFTVNKLAGGVIEGVVKQSVLRDADNAEKLNIKYTSVGTPCTIADPTYTANGVTTAKDYTTEITGKKFILSIKKKGTDTELLNAGAWDSGVKFYNGDTLVITVGKETDFTGANQLEVIATDASNAVIPFDSVTGTDPYGANIYELTITKNTTLTFNTITYPNHKVVVKCPSTRVPTMNINERGGSTEVKAADLGKEYVVFESDDAKLTVAPATGYDIEVSAKSGSTEFTIANRKLVKNGNTYTVSQDNGFTGLTAPLEFTVTATPKAVSIKETDADNKYSVRVRIGAEGDNFKQIGTSGIEAGYYDDLYFRVYYDGEPIERTKIGVNDSYATTTTGAVANLTTFTVNGVAKTTLTPVSGDDYSFKLASDEINGNDVIIGANVIKAKVYDTRGIASGYDQQFYVVESESEKTNSTATPGTPVALPAEADAKLDTDYVFTVGTKIGTDTYKPVTDGTGIVVEYVVLAADNATATGANDMSTLDGQVTSASLKWTTIGMEDDGTYVIPHLKKDKFGELTENNFTGNIFVRVTSGHGLSVERAAGSEKFDAVYLVDSAGSVTVANVVSDANTAGNVISENSTAISFKESDKLLNSTGKLYIAVKNQKKYSVKLTSNVEGVLTVAADSPVTVGSDTWAVYEVKTWKQNATTGNNEYIDDLVITIDKDEKPHTLTLTQAATNPKKGTFTVTDKNGEVVKEGTGADAGKYAVVESGEYTIKLEIEEGLYGNAVIEGPSANATFKATATEKVWTISDITDDVTCTLTQAYPGYSFNMIADNVVIGELNAKFDKWDSASKKVVTNGEVLSMSTPTTVANSTAYFPTGNITLSWKYTANPTKKVKQVVLFNTNSPTLPTDCGDGSKVINTITNITGTTLTIPANKDIKYIYVMTEDDPDALYNISFVIPDDDDVTVKAPGSAGDVYKNGETYLSTENLAVDANETVYVEPKAGYTATVWVDGKEVTGLTSGSGKTYQIPKFEKGKLGAANKKTVRVETEAIAITKDKYFQFETGGAVPDGVVSAEVISGAEVYDAAKNKYVAEAGKAEVLFNVTLKKGYVLNDIETATATASKAVRATEETRRADGDNWIYSYKIVLDQLSGGTDTPNAPAKIKLNPEQQKFDLTLGAGSKSGAKMVIGDDSEKELASKTNIDPGTDITIKALPTQVIQETISGVTNDVAFTRDDDGNAVYTFKAALVDDPDNLYTPTNTERTFVISDRNDLEEYRAYLVDADGNKVEGTTLEIPYSTTKQYKVVMDYLDPTGTKGDVTENTTYTFKQKIGENEATDVTPNEVTSGAAKHYEAPAYPTQDVEYTVKLVKSVTNTTSHITTETVVIPETTFTVKVTGIARKVETESAVDNVIKVKANGKDESVVLKITDTVGNELEGGKVTPVLTNNTGRLITMTYDAETKTIKLNAKASALDQNKTEELSFKDETGAEIENSKYTIMAVKPVGAEAITLSGSKVSLKLGKTISDKVAITVTGKKDDKAGEDITADIISDVQVVSSNPAVATAEKTAEDGKYYITVNAVGEGSTDITVSLAGIESQTIAVTVRAASAPGGGEEAPEETDPTGDDNYRKPGEERKDISKLFKSESVKLANKDKYVATYNGKAQTPAVKLPVKLTKDIDYKVTYRNNVNVSDVEGKDYAIAVISGINEYNGSVEVPFTIQAKSIKKATIVVGSAKADESEEFGYFVAMSVYDGTKMLVEDSDYEISNIESADRYGKKVKVTIKAVEGSNYYGANTKNDVKTAVATVVTKSGNMFSCDIDTPEKGVSYTGKAITTKTNPGLVVVTNPEGKTLTEGKDYTLSYKNNKEAGLATVLVKGKGDYDGTITGIFEIKKSEKPLTVSITNGRDGKIVYNGKLQKPKVTVKSESTTLKANRDYVLYYRGELNAGEDAGYVEIHGIGNYAGLSLTEASEGTHFTIAAQDITKAKINYKASNAKKGTPSSIAITYNKKNLTEEDFEAYIVKGKKGYDLYIKGASTSDDAKKATANFYTKYDDKKSEYKCLKKTGISEADLSYVMETLGISGITESVNDIIKKVE